MTKYIIKRLLLAVLTVFIICAITFFLMHAIPGGPFNREKALDPATIAALNARYNLDKPLVVQFGIYIKENNPLNRSDREGLAACGYPDIKDAELKDLKKKDKDIDERTAAK